ncbi:hypothetical protein [Pedobacter sp. NJ-S-72]
MKKYEPLRFLAFIAILLLLLVFLQVRSYAQSPLGKKLSISLKNEPLKSALDKISLAGGIKFTYNEQVANSKLKITVLAQDKSLNDVLTKVFSGQPFKFTELGQEVYIKFDAAKEKKVLADPAANPAEGQGRHTISGTISSSKTGET